MEPFSDAVCQTDKRLKSSSETVWNIGNYPEIGVLKATKRGRRGPDRAPLGAEAARS
jgi:hypothetical protein